MYIATEEVKPTLCGPSSLVPSFSSSLSQLLEVVYSHLQNIGLVGSSVGVCCRQDLSESIDTGVNAGSSSAFNQRFWEFANLGKKEGQSGLYQEK